jgi:methionine-rich copper-binding protein CopC
MAHGELLTAEPMPGTTLTAAPAEIHLSFGEPLATTGTFLVWADNFQQLPDIGAAVDRQSPKQLVAPVPGLTPGPYTFQWTSVAKMATARAGVIRFPSRLKQNVRVALSFGGWSLP